MRKFNKSSENVKRQHVRTLLKKGLGAGACAALIGGMIFGSMVSAEEGAADSGKVKLLMAEASDEGENLVDMAEYRAKGSLDVSDIVEKAMPSVVSITTKSVQEVMDYFSMFGFSGGYAPQQREVEGRGSGVIIGKNDDELLIVTNAHVVDGAENISVGFVNNTAVEAVVKGFDEVKDLAVVAVKKEDLDEDTLNQISIAKIGSSDDIKVGEQVVAIGNAMGYGQSVTTGIVSAKTHYSENSRESYSQYNDDESGVNLIQTDAAINPGNSGGALLNMDGELIGINQSKLASYEIEGMCYAIAISDVDNEVIEELMNEEYREKLDDDEHGILGLTGSTVSAEEASKYGFPEGVYVAEVTENGPADEAGIKEGDFITGIENKSVDSIYRLIEYLSYYEPGEEVEVTVFRDGGEEVFTVTLGEQTEDFRGGPDADRDDEEDEEDIEEPEEEENFEESENDDETSGSFDDIWDSLG